MRNSQSRITLIELVMIIVSLSLFSVIAIPKLIELRCNSKSIAAKRYARSLTAASESNYAMYKEKNPVAIPLHNCQDITKVLGGKLPSGYSILSRFIQDNEVVTCVLYAPGPITAMFSATGVPGEW